MKKELRDDLTDVPNKTTIKVSNQLRDKLAEIGNKDETFEDVIKRLIRRAEPERSGEIVTSKSSVIQYRRKKEFIELAVWIGRPSIHGNIKKGGFEYEYNAPPKKEGDWELDIKIIKVFYQNKSYNPSEFFGVGNDDKYMSEEFIRIYFQLLVDILNKEFGIPPWREVPSVNELNVMGFRSIYYRHKLSHESFINDVEDVLRDFSDKKIDDKTKKQINNSVVGH